MILTLLIVNLTKSEDFIKYFSINANRSGQEYVIIGRLVRKNSKHSFRNSDNHDNYYDTIIKGGLVNDLYTVNGSSTFITFDQGKEPNFENTGRWVGEAEEPDNNDSHYEIDYNATPTKQKNLVI